MDEDEPLASTDNTNSSTSDTASTPTSTASICITPLSGAQTGSSSALSTLLEFDDAKILLDCGINPHREEMVSENYEQDRIEYLDRLKECVSLSFD